MNGIPNALQSSERAIQKDYRIKDSWTAKYVQLKAEEQLMEYPDATWNGFWTHNIQEDVMLQVCSKFLYVVEHIKTQLVRKRQEMRNLRTELQEHRVICMEGNFRPWAPTQKANQKTVWLCNNCQKNVHPPKWCRKEMRGEEIRRVQHDMSFNKSIAPIREYGTSDSNFRSEHDQNVDRCLVLDDVNIPTNKSITTEDETCQDESKVVTPLEPKVVSTTIGKSFNRASTGESEVEQYNPLPLGY